MKIHVIKIEQPVIEGYKQVIAFDDYINFMDISNNECEEILATDVLDSFSIDKVNECIVSLVNKLRLGGKLVVGGKDIRLFCRSVLNNMISEVDASHILKSTKSMPPINSVLEIITSLGLQIVTSTINGIHFEIVAKRG